MHNLFTSAVQLADNAAKIRREAALTGNIARAWDASSAAAGALMLATQARTDLLVALQAAASFAVITPRRTRLVRVPDLHDFRRAIASLCAARAEAVPGADRSTPGS